MENILAAVTPSHEGQVCTLSAPGIARCVFPKIEECPTILSISLRILRAVVHLGGARRTVRRVLELKKAIVAKVQVDLNVACTLYQW